MTSDGVLARRFSFARTNGAHPLISLVQSTDGNFYGTTTTGGTYDQGTVFRISIPIAPVIQSFTSVSNVLTLTWSAVAGQAYQVQYNSDFVSAHWSNWGGILVASNGTMSASDVIGPELQRLYRVVLLP
jgi:uncharacterized repeat protein (TIGR03803 family)